MCPYQAWEDDSILSEDFIQSTLTGIDLTEMRLEARIAMLGLRMTRRLESSLNSIWSLVKEMDS
ncbi:hypothetical protein TorRG33x02_078400 [Trema orientale]|uniref:Uncharacterized protein n=1 Tax=Trema orientale TaxID=63057 RepID=A0A2P5FEM6_TREOI|nr:hypothetical protein TorRG33x02_078400 [Trema orientale]